MLISKTPYRVSFAGGGTDLPHWASKYGGAVISTTIDKFCYITCKKLPSFYDYKYHFGYSATEHVEYIHQIKHPGIRGVFQTVPEQKTGMSILHDGDLPARSGLGSSSSFIVGLLNVVYALRGRRLTNLELAREAIYIEQKINKEGGGSQDQVAASFGGLNKIVFHKDGTFDVQKIQLKKEKIACLNDQLILFYTGVQRHSSLVEKSKLIDWEKRHDKYLGLLELVTELEKTMLSSTFQPEDLGKFLDHGWRLKKELSDQVSHSKLDEVYEAAKMAGAIGGKLLGAGGGGFFLFCVKPGMKNELKKSLSGLKAVDFQFCNEGSSIFNLNN